MDADPCQHGRHGDCTAPAVATVVFYFADYQTASDLCAAHLGHHVTEVTLDLPVERYERLEIKPL